MKSLFIFITIILLLIISLIPLIRFYPYSFSFTSYPKLTSTESKINGDPINLIFFGTKSEITQSFLKAGWLIPDPITLKTSARIATDSIFHRSYPTAPVSNLYLFGRVQDMVFEKPTQDVQKRDHIRIWNNGKNIWIAQASYDNGIQLSGANLIPTHHIAPVVDVERDRVGMDLENTGLVKSESYNEFTSPIFSAQNAGGDFYESDGDILVINYSLFYLPKDDNTIIYNIKNYIFSMYTNLISRYIN